MFDKIVIIDSKIVTAKCIIEWEEEFPIGFDEESGQEQFKTETRFEWAVSESDKEMLIQSLEKRNIEYKITGIDISESVQVHDGEEWAKGRDEAILYINGIGEYNPVSIEVKRLRQQLADTDYKAIKFAEGILSGLEFEVIRIQRQGWRDEINALEQQLKDNI